MSASNLFIYYRINQGHLTLSEIVVSVYVGILDIFLFLVLQFILVCVCVCVFARAQALGPPCVTSVTNMIRFAITKSYPNKWTTDTPHTSTRSSSLCVRNK